MTLIKMFANVCYSYKIEDTALLTKLSSGDMIATEAKYHSRCLVALCNRARITVDADI